ncbi:MAG: hypothetical protein GW762_02165 [Candidatus Pacebacteria bacterium]|nr:hypothetical protein [Candidatus Paceibacterota bacterium]PIR63560.1 MAG: hypothetical protein COU64_03830 [Candidatus Pacebacteria bacterium CG10_big_fil_rev_8_21_14_0_10_40_26]PIZ79216.1 MAG: hypothetical protein COY01_02205 [Candidatus Pacebacteria bacterium CG_4_10_14_0_2_um_filter_40_20]PJA68871.1 MAG: hypothetical protein CO156_02810 [Candidatus Pacebacteria bacterium CG_4_9_14_3_um_filter_40_12]PJC42183.1 MAG: hypothetical protein CO041_00915 [Candidatus Pacebacteria bacterium CG_4_9_
MERTKYPHDRNKYSQLFALAKESFQAGDADGLETYISQANSLYSEGYMTRQEKKDITKLVHIFLDVLLHPFNDI